MYENEEIDMDDSLGEFLDKCRKYHFYCYCFDVQEDIQREYPELSFDEIHKLRLGDIWHYIGSLKPRKKRR